MKNLKALSIALLLGMGSLSLSLCAGDQPTTSVSATTSTAELSASTNQPMTPEQKCADLEIRVKYLESWKNYHRVTLAFALVAFLIAVDAHS